MKKSTSSSSGNIKNPSSSSKMSRLYLNQQKSNKENLVSKANLICRKNTQSMSNSSANNSSILGSLNQFYFQQRPPKNNLNLKSSVYNITINGANKQKPQVSSIFQYSVMKQSNNRLRKQIFLQSLLFSKDTTEFQISRRDQEQSSESLLITDKCCGCMNMHILKKINTPLKKKWNKYYSEDIFDYFFKEKRVYTRNELKQKIRRFFLNNTLSFRLEQIEEFLNQIFQSYIQVCHRKFGIFLQMFSQSNKNQLFNVFEKLNEQYFSFSQLKMMLARSNRNLHESWKGVLEDVKQDLENREWFNYWDLYLIKDKWNCQKLIEILNQYLQSIE